MRILDLTASVRRSNTVWLISYSSGARFVVNTGVFGINKYGRARSENESQFRSAKVTVSQAQGLSDFQIKFGKLKFQIVSLRP